MINVRVPDHWTGRQALVVCSFLEEVARAIWDRHGDQMAHVLYDLYGLEPDTPATPPLSPCPSVDGPFEDSPYFLDDDIPF